MYQMKFPRIFILLLLLALASSLLWFSGSTLASDDRAVDLASFVVEPLADGRMHIEWATGSEDNTAHFRVIRAVYPNTPIHPADLISVTYNTVAVNEIPAQGGPGNGANYLAFDVDATDGVTYTYILVEQDSSGFFTPENGFAVTVQAGDVATADVVISPSTSVLLGSPTMPAEHLFTVTNESNRTATLKASNVSGSYQWAPSFSPIIFQLAPGASRTLTATVTPNANAGACASDTATIKVETINFFNDSDSALAYPTTTQPCVYLPIVINP